MPEEAQAGAISQVMYRKWRPQTLAEVVGQEVVTTILLHALEAGRLAHAYLFCGPRGTGKTSTGRILAKAVNCLNNGRGEPCNTCSLCLAITEGSSMDVVEIDAASNRGIDDIRRLRDRVGFVPQQAKHKVYIIDEVHMLSDPAANALLKTLEEPPPHVIFVLATTEYHKVPPTIMSRCQRFDFHRLSHAAVVSRLSYICQQEKVRVGEESLRLVARSCGGSLRDAENLLEQLVTYYGSELQPHQVQSLLGLGDTLRARQLVLHMVKRDIASGLATIGSVNADGLDLRQFRREVVEVLRGLLVAKAGSPDGMELPPEEMVELQKLAVSISLGRILQALKLFATSDSRLDNYPSLPLELALVESCLPEGEGEEAGAAVAEGKLDPTAEKRPAPVVEERLTVVQVEPVSTVEERPVTAREKAVAEKVPVAAAEALDSSAPVEQLKAGWKKILGASRSVNKTIEALLRSSCEPVGVEGDTIILGFSYPLHKAKIEEPENMKTVEAVLSQALGASFKVRCILKSRDKKAGDDAAAKGHLVRAAMEIGGKVISVEDK